MVDYDIVIVGGGPAGVGAALAAAKNGLRTAIVERHSMLGGNWTSGYVLSILGVYTYDGTTKIVGGIADEVIENLKAYKGTNGQSHNFVPFRPDEMKLSLDSIVKKYGIDVYINSLVTGASVESGMIMGVDVDGKDGLKRIGSKMFVDSSGDADLAYLSTGQVMEGKEGEGWHQEATLPFRLEGVDEKKVIDFANEHKDLVGVVMNGGRIERLRILPPLVKKAKSERKLYLPDANSEFLFNTMRPGEFVCNATHAKISDFKDALGVSAAMHDLRHQVVSSLNFLIEEVGGFEKAYLMDSAPSIGMRETRRAIGEYVLRREDVLGNKRFDDAIARCGHPLEIHDPVKGVVYEHLRGGDGSWYHIPYGSIVVKGVGNLFAIGRCLSAEFDAQASARVTGTAMAMGHAAAVAASIAIAKSASAKDVPVHELQDKLKAQGAII